MWLVDDYIHFHNPTHKKTKPESFWAHSIAKLFSQQNEKMWPTKQWHHHKIYDKSWRLSGKWKLEQFPKHVLPAFPNWKWLLLYKNKNINMNLKLEKNRLDKYKIQLNIIWQENLSKLAGHH